MKVHVVYLGPARDWAGGDGDTFDVMQGTSVEGLIEHMVEARPELGVRRGVLRFAVNEEFTDTQTVLSDGDRVAVIPPVSGGCDALEVVEIVDTPIDAVAFRRHLGADSAVGGVVIFEGVTRFERDAESGGLVALDYEAYRDMAVAEMGKLAAAARRRWAVRRVAIVHRVGSVPVGEASVMIGVASGHRAEAFEACRYLIDALKRDVPIWKKETWESGASRWVDPT